jgi:hypothetical protein
MWCEIGIVDQFEPLYTALAARRLAWETLLGQVPTLSHGAGILVHDRSRS